MTCCNVLSSVRRLLYARSSRHSNRMLEGSCVGSGIGAIRVRSVAGRVARKR